MATTDPYLQQALANDGLFRQRLKAALATVAGQVFAEDPATAGHATRVTYARSVLQTLDATAGQIAGWFVTRTNVTGANASLVLVGVTPTVQTDATDAALQSQLATDWNSLAGV